MTRQALAQDRGLQPERTALAWTRTSLAVFVSGGLVVLKDRDAVHLFDHPLRVAVGAVAVTVAGVLFVIGAWRRRALSALPSAARSAARREVFGAGAAVLALTVLVVTYLVLPVW